MKKDSKGVLLKSEALLNMLEDLDEANKEAEAEKRMVDNIMDSMIDGLCITDTKGTLIKVNKALAEMHGYKSSKEIIGKKFFDFVAKKELPRIIKKFKENIKKNGFLRNFEVTILKKDGKQLPVMLNINSLFDEDGAFIGNISIVRDASEQKKAEKELQKSEQRYRDLIENANDLTQSVDVNGKFVYVNKKWKKVLGYSDGEVKKLRFTDILRKDQIQHCVGIFKKLCKGQSFEHVKTVFVSKKGKEVFVSGNLNAQFEDSKFVATRGIFRDITKQKGAEEELLKQKEKYEKEINKLKEKLKKRK